MSKEDLHQLKRDIFQSSPVYCPRRSHHSCLFHSINFHFFPFSTDSYALMLPSFVISILREIALLWKRMFSVMLFLQLREMVFIFASYNSIHCALLIISEKPLVFARLIIR